MTVFQVLLIVVWVSFIASMVVSYFGNRIVRGCLRDKNFDDSIPPLERISRLERGERYILMSLYLALFAFILSIVNFLVFGIEKV